MSDETSAGSLLEMVPFFVVATSKWIRSDLMSMIAFSGRLMVTTDPAVADVAPDVSKRNLLRENPSSLAAANATDFGM
jgi:hypothetical protein